jgi:hypothetical protein
MRGAWFVNPKRIAKDGQNQAYSVLQAGGFSGKVFAKKN